MNEENEIINTDKKILHLGCGQNKPESHFGIDFNERSDADLIYDLNKRPWPFADNTFTEIFCPAILEHLPDFYGVMEEIWRVAESGAMVHINVPHYTDTAAFTDPTHVTYFTTYSFDVLTKNTKWEYYTEARFTLKLFRVRLLKLYKYLFIESVLNWSIKNNALRFIHKAWENYFSYIIRGKSMDLVLEVVK